jgi:hypothetical protein
LGAVTLLLAASGRVRHLNDLTLQLLSRRSAMQRLAAAQLALFGIVATVGAGIHGL